jgi:hypothetical protein
MQAFDLYGSSTWARTRDLRINSPALYRLSYRGTAFNYSPKIGVLILNLWFWVACLMGLVA